MCDGPGPTCKVPRREIALVIAVAVLVLLMSVQLRRSERMPPLAATTVFTAAPPPPQGCFAEVGFPGRPPRKIVDVKPVYPEAARARHITGTVIIAATIDENGRIIRAEVRRSVEMLDTAAVDAVKRWQFAPATLHGIAVCLTIDVAVIFVEDVLEREKTSGATKEVGAPETGLCGSKNQSPDAPGQ